MYVYTPKAANDYTLGMIQSHDFRSSKHWTGLDLCELIFHSIIRKYMYMLITVMWLLTLGAHAQQRLQYLVCESDCLFVYDYSRTTSYEVAYERYQQLQCYKGMKNNALAETTAIEIYNVKTSETANMHNEHWLTSTRFSPFNAPWTN